MGSSGWTSRAVGAALQQAVVEGRHPAPLAVRAMLTVAMDPATRSPGRVLCAGPWWEAAPSASRATPEEHAAELVQLEAHLAEADGRRVWAQRRARKELASRGEPVTRLAVARLACRLLADAEEQAC